MDEIVGGINVRPEPDRWSGNGHTQEQDQSRVEASTIKLRKVAFVLSGGGSLGSMQVGVVEAAFEQGLYPDLMVGTSVGALNGAWLARTPAQKGVQELKQIWMSLTADSIFSGGHFSALLRILLGRDHVYTDKGLRNLIARNLGNLSFEDLVVPFYVTAADIGNGERRVFHQGPLAPAILASTAIPGVFPPVTIDGHTYVDGGILGRSAIDVAIKNGATHVVVVQCPHLPPGSNYGILRPISRALWVSLGRIWNLEMEKLRLECQVPTLWLEPETDLTTYRREDFSRSAQLMDKAREWATVFLQGKVEAFLQPAPGVPSPQVMAQRQEAMGLAH